MGFAVDPPIPSGRLSKAAEDKGESPAHRPAKVLHRHLVGAARLDRCGRRGNIEGANRQRRASQEMRACLPFRRRRLVPQKLQLSARLADKQPQHLRFEIWSAQRLVAQVQEIERRLTAFATALRIT